MIVEKNTDAATEDALPKTTQFTVKHLNRKEINRLFFLSILELVGIILSVRFAFIKNGQIPWYFGIIGILLMAISFGGAVYGWGDHKTLKADRRYKGLIGTWIHTFVFIIMLAFYIIGLFV